MLTCNPNVIHATSGWVLNKSGINKCRTYFRRDVPIATLLLVWQKQYTYKFKFKNTVGIGEKCKVKLLPLTSRKESEKIKQISYSPICFLIFIMIQFCCNEISQVIKLRMSRRLHFCLDSSVSASDGGRLTKVKEVHKDANGSKLVTDYFSYPRLGAHMSQKDIAKSSKFVLPQMTVLGSR